MPPIHARGLKRVNPGLFPFVDDHGCDRENRLLLCRGQPRVIDAAPYPKREENLFLVKEVLSRKKQVLPYIVDLLQTL